MPVHVVGVCLLIEFGEALEVDPGSCSCLSRGSSEGVSAAFGEKGGEPGLRFVLVPEVLPLQGMHGPVAVSLWPPLAAASSSSAVILHTPGCRGALPGGA